MYELRRNFYEPKSKIRGDFFERQREEKQIFIFQVKRNRKEKNYEGLYEERRR